MPSFDQALARLGGRGRMLKLAVWALLAVHVGWIATHLSLVSQDAINPWKLGGYGMYTIAHPTPLTHVYLFDERTQGWVEIPRAARQFNTFAFDDGNDLFVFRCRRVTEASLVGFYDENPHLLLRPLTLIVSEQRFTRDPIGSVREPHQVVEIAWGGPNRFGYRGEVCGEKYDGQIAYTPPEE